MNDYGNSEREVRVQFMLPWQLQQELEKLPLVFLPVGPLEWHGSHMAVGMDPINAENVALALARKVGGVVLPTLYAGTERERDPETLKSLGFKGNEYVVGMDFPTIKNLYKSFYFTEELFALIVRGYIEACIEHGYRFIYIVNGHGAVNHNAVLRRLSAEFSNSHDGVQVTAITTFPEELQRIGALGHASAHETSLLMHYHPDGIDVKRLPPTDIKLKYSEHAIVNNGGFCGRPGPGYTLPEADDPRISSSAEKGKRLYEQIVEELAEKVRKSVNV
jgi:creatinine amidohydrolase